MDQPIDERLARLVRAEFNEMPGLRLTCPQGARLWGVDQRACRRVLDQLVRTGFLMQLPHERYARVGDDETAAAARIAKMTATQTLNRRAS